LWFAVSNSWLSSLSRATALAHFAFEVAHFAGSKFVDYLPEALIRGDCLSDARQVFLSEMERLGAPIEVDRQEVAAVSCLWVTRAGAVWFSAASDALDDAAAHERGERECAHFLVELASSPKGIVAVRSHICNTNS
jgi:hypothetical protein